MYGIIQTKIPLRTIEEEIVMQELINKRLLEQAKKDAVL